mmetsp:Transcript_26687/g.77663  ORF Transcript_26687/g.77663 Transcript_26687/m.77663 type:complete len:269 (-) Transcript_26687:85-891(-)
MAGSPRVKKEMMRILRTAEDPGGLTPKKVRHEVEAALRETIGQSKAWFRQTLSDLFEELEGDKSEQEDILLTQESSTGLLQTQDSQGEDPGAAGDLDSKASPAGRGLKLTIPAKVARTKGLLIHLHDHALDFQNDTGAIGRLSLKARRLTVDLKGQQYTATVMPSPTLMVVNMSSTEAKAEMMLDEVCTLGDATDVVKSLSGNYLQGGADSGEEQGPSGLRAAGKAPSHRGAARRSQNKSKRKANKATSQQPEAASDAPSLSQKRKRT